jgi:hypothetical protein
MRRPVCSILIAWLLVAGSVGTSGAQQAEPTTRTAAIEQSQAEKAATLTPYVPNRGERLGARIQNVLTGEGRHFYPFFESAYSGGGFALGAGYLRHVSPYNFLDVRGSYSVAGYLRTEAEFVAPRLFHRRGHLSLLGGYRDATQVKFFGRGMDSSPDARVNYAFERPYVSGMLTVRPTRRYLTLRGGLEWTRWSLKPASGRFPSIETVFPPGTLTGVGARTTYLHTQATVGFDSRPSAGYARRGGFYGVTGHDYKDRDDVFGFRQIDYEAIQHVPILRETWALSFHALVRTTADRNGQSVPFFMLPTLGGSSSLRGYTSLRFRDENSLLLQAEWRIMASRFLDTAVFYDTGKVVSHRSELDFEGLVHNWGFGIRFHGPVSTPLRFEIAHGDEGFVFVASTSSAF